MIKFMHLLLIVASGVLTSVPSLSKDDEKSGIHDLNSYAIVLLLPVNILEEKGARINLQVNTPKEFKCLQKEAFLKDATSIAPMLEFIPKKDNENNWSEILTSHTYIGKSLKADELISYMKENFVKNSTDPKILEEKTTQGDSFDIVTITIAYTHNGRREVVRIKAFSGPADCVSIQYAVALKKGQTEVDAFKKVKLWMEDEKNLKTIKF